MFRSIFSFLLILTSLVACCFVEPLWAQNIPEAELGTANITAGNQQPPNGVGTFMNAFTDYFITDNTGGAEGALKVFTQIAYGIKNFFVIIAVIFLIIGVLKILFSEASENDVEKWKSNIVWTTVGIFLMQIAYSIWTTMLSGGGGSGFSSMLAWDFWNNIIAPIVQLLQFLASFAFLAMMIYAFYIIITGGGDEEKLKKGYHTLGYGLVGILLIQVPYRLVSLIYGDVPDCAESATLWSFAGGSCTSNSITDVDGVVELIGKFFQFFHGFLTLFCVLMAIYAGWLLLASRGEEDSVKKAKRVILYMVIGLIMLVASHAIFRFFIMK